MIKTAERGFSFSKLIPLFLLFASTCTALAQAWLPERNEGSFTTSYNYLSFGGHFRSDGSRTPEAASIAQSALFNFEYAFTDDFAVTISLPIVSARYNDTNPSTAVLRTLFNQTIQAIGPGFYKHPFLDDGHYHTTAQDFYFGGRYNLISRPLMLTPFVALGTPSHDYAYVGEASPGRNLTEFQFGTYIGRRLNPFLRKAYTQSEIAFAIPQKALNIRTTRTNMSLELGYFVTRKLAFRGIGDWQHTFNGLHFPKDLTTPELVLTHERLLKSNYWHLGGGASFAISPKTDVSIDYVNFLTGSDTHYGSGVSIGISRSFTLVSAKHSD